MAIYKATVDGGGGVIWGSGLTREGRWGFFGGLGVGGGRVCGGGVGRLGYTFV
ncbi:MAG: hypothetical protein NZM04_00240 [Methylacidiphilales bacterium]|nr:hypothetical protein [Candidatus Methylacidiphilales bacterium]